MGLVEVLEADEGLLALKTTVNAGAEHDGVGAAVRVTNWLAAVVVGHDSQTIVDAGAVAVAATPVYAWITRV